MAPLATYIVHTMYDVSVQARSLRDNNNAGTSPALTTRQENVLQVLGLTFATISVASALLAGYWFVKMRRSFRHQYVHMATSSDDGVC